MKRRSVKNQILKALTIGISACMAMQPVTALAAEEGVVEPSNTDQGQEQQQNQQQQQEPSINQEANEAVDTALTAVNDAIDHNEKSAQETAAEQAEASDAIDHNEESAQETASEKTEISEAINEINKDLGVTKTSVENINDNTDTLEKLNKAAKEAVDTFEQATTQKDLTNADLFENAARVEAGNAQTAEEASEKDAETAKKAAGNVSDSAAAVYDSQADADKARKEAENSAAEADSAAKDAEKHVLVAQKAADNAEADANAAKEKYETAQTAYDDAANKVKLAENKLQDIMNQYGLKNKDLEGNTEYTGDVKAAIDSARDALSIAENEQSRLLTELNALKEKSKSAQTAYEEAKKQLDAGKEAVTKALVSETESNLQNARDAQTSLNELAEKISEYESAAQNSKKTDGSADFTNYWKSNDSLSKEMIKYGIMTEGNDNIDLSTLKISGFTRNGDNYCTVTYNLTDGTQVKRYFDYEAYESAEAGGERINSKAGDNIDGSYILIIEKSDLTKENGKDKFVNRNVYMSQNELAASLETTKKEYNDNVTKAQSVADQVKAVSDNYDEIVNLKQEIITEATQSYIPKAQANLESAKKDADEYDHLISDIKANTAKVGETSNFNQFFNAYDALSKNLIKYSFYQNLANENIDMSTVKFSGYNNNWEYEHHYMTVTYKLKGSSETVTRYFDYEPVDENGKAIINDGSTKWSDVKTSQIVIKEKKYLGSNGNYILFDTSSEYNNGKGKDYFVQGNFVDNSKEYRENTEGKAQSELDSLNRALSDLQNLKEKSETLAGQSAEKISAAQKASDDATVKLTKVKTAYEQVVAMSKALENLKAQKGVSQTAVSALETAYKAALKSYEEAQKSADKAVENFNIAKAEAQRAMTALLNGGFAVAAPLSSAENTASDSDESSASTVTTIADCSFRVPTSRTVSAPTRRA